MDGLGDFLLELYRLANACPAKEFQAEAMNLLQTQVKFDSGRWAHGRHKLDGERTLLENHMQNEPPELLKGYMEVAGLDDPMLRLLRLNPQRYATRSYRSRSQWHHLPNGAMRDYQVRFRHENVLMAVGKTVVGTDIEFRFLGMYRAHPERVFCDQDNTVMLGLLPHMLQAQTINRVTNLVAQAQASEDESHGFGIADFSGNLHFCDDTLRALFTENWPFARSGYIPPAMWERLQSGGCYRDQRVSANAWRAHGMVLVRARRRCAADNLTAREKRVGQLVSNGLTHKEIARAMDITPATARNYMQKLQDKLGAHGKVGIAAMMAQAVAHDPPIARHQNEQTFLLTPAGR